MNCDRRMGSLDLDSERCLRVNVPKGSWLPQRERWLSSAASVRWYRTRWRDEAEEERAGPTSDGVPTGFHN